MRPTVLAALVLVAGCRSGGDETTGFGSSITTAPQATSSGGSDTSTSTSMSTSSSSSSAEDSAAASSASPGSTTSAASSGGFPDVGTPPDGGSGPPPGCKGKVDFLFSISSSWTMEGAQDQLKASFPGFIKLLADEFADFDYHILSANTRESWVLPWCEGCQDVCLETPGYPCGATPEPCDSVHGAGVTFPVGDNASNKRCDLASGRRYITAPQPTINATFKCIASVGTTGVDRVAQTALKALGDQINAEPNGCNAGFLRPDALLVVVAVQDTQDEDSEGTPQDWADALIAAKGGDGDAVVLLVISNDRDDPDSLCGYNWGSSEHELRTWTQLMPHGLFRSICVPDLAPYFKEAATAITEQCEVFVPQ